MLTPSTFYTKMTTRKHFVDFHELDYTNFRLMEIFILNINRPIIFSFFAILIPCIVFAHYTFRLSLLQLLQLDHTTQVRVLEKMLCFWEAFLLLYRHCSSSCLGEVVTSWWMTKAFTSISVHCSVVSRSWVDTAGFQFTRKIFFQSQKMGSKIPCETDYEIISQSPPLYTPVSSFWTESPNLSITSSSLWHLRMSCIQILHEWE